MVYRRKKRLPRTARSYAAALPLFYICLHSSREMRVAPGNQVRYLGVEAPRYYSIVPYF
jgi:hypothetical protein